MNQSLPQRLWRRLSFFISENEKVLLALLSIVIVVSGAFWFRQYAENQDSRPNIGGTYVEGVVGDQEVVNVLVSKLTRLGLFTFDSTGELTPVLVESWTKNDASTEYEFKIKDSISAQDVADQLIQNIDILGTVNISAEGQTLKLVSLTPNPNIPILLTQPLVEGGPYKLSKSTQTTTVLTKNPNTLGDDPYINKIIIHRFDSQEELNRAISRRRVDGALSVMADEKFTHFVNHQIKPPRYFGVVLNLNRSPFRDESFRKTVLGEGQIPARDIVLTVPDQQPQRQLAEELIVKWQERGARVAIKLESLEDFTNKTLPTRNFEAVLMGIDYGLELDPFYIWNSDQIRPPSNNVSGVRDTGVDQAITSIRGTNNIIQRNKLIAELHQKLAELGVAKILEQQTFNTLISNQIYYVATHHPLTIHDKFEKINRWYLK